MPHDTKPDGDATERRAWMAQFWVEELQLWDELVRDGKLMERVENVEQPRSMDATKIGEIEGDATDENPEADKHDTNQEHEGDSADSGEEPEAGVEGDEEEEEDPEEIRYGVTVYGSTFLY